MKVAGRRGFFRFVGILDAEHVEVVGPVGRAGEGLRVVRLDALRPAGRRVSKDDVAMAADTKKLSEMARTWRRR